MEDRHVIEAVGMSRVVVSNGKVVEVGEPEINSCPLAKRFRCKVDPINKENMKENIESRVNLFGMCTKDREVLDKESFVLFGASELLTTALRRNTVDCAIICCDGAGTVIVTSPELVQGIGGRMSGLVETVPYAEVIERIETAGGVVVDKETASLDVLKGLETATAQGFTKPAVTVAGFQHELAEEIRRKFPETVIIAVHTTPVKSLDDAKRLFASCDLIFACASKYIREAASSALVQGGVGVPVFASSKKGKQIIMERLIETDSPILVKNIKLPVMDMGSQPKPLI
ncbi:MAG: DUF2099 family protein [Methanocorpusculum sp.]|nr:DUF2099 family protein [Methanocorpusculum sp.]